MKLKFVEEKTPQLGLEAQTEQKYIGIISIKYIGIQNTIPRDISPRN